MMVAACFCFLYLGGGEETWDIHLWTANRSWDSWTLCQIRHLLKQGVKSEEERAGVATCWRLQLLRWTTLNFRVVYSDSARKIFPGIYFTKTVVVHNEQLKLTKAAAAKKMLGCCLICIYFNFINLIWSGIFKPVKYVQLFLQPMETENFSSSRTGSMVMIWDPWVSLFLIFSW